MALTVPALITYLREPEGSVDFDAAAQIVDLTNALIDEVIAPLNLTAEPSRVQALRYAVAARAYWNPEGHIYQAANSTSWRDEGHGRAGVYLTDAEKGELLALTGGTTAGSWAGSMPYRR